MTLLLGGIHPAALRIGLVWSATQFPHHSGRHSIGRRKVNSSVTIILTAFRERRLDKAGAESTRSLGMTICLSAHQKYY